MHETPHTAAGDLYDPLSVFYNWNRRPPPDFDVLDPAPLPPPYRSLLLPNEDMTPKLGAFRGEHVHIEPIHVLYDADTCARQAILRLQESAWPVEYGAVRIHLSRLPKPLRDEARGSVDRCGTCACSTMPRSPGHSTWRRSWPFMPG